MSVDMNKVIEVYQQERELTKELNRTTSLDKRVAIQFQIQKLIYENLNSEEALKLHFMLRNEKSN